MKKKNQKLMTDNLRERERERERETRKEEKVLVKVEILGVCLLILHFFLLYSIFAFS